MGMYANVARRLLKRNRKQYDDLQTKGELGALLAQLETSAQEVEAIEMKGLAEKDPLPEDPWDRHEKLKQHLAAARELATADMQDTVKALLSPS